MIFIAQGSGRLSLHSILLTVLLAAIMQVVTFNATFADETLKRYSGEWLYYEGGDYTGTKILDRDGVEVEIRQNGDGNPVGYVKVDGWKNFGSGRTKMWSLKIAGNRIEFSAYGKNRKEMSAQGTITDAAIDANLRYNSYKMGLKLTLND